jgi:polysaccharide export outer membrane protein
MKKLSYVSLLVSLLVFGLAAMGQTSAADESAAKPAPGVVANDATYTIGADDVVAIGVWKEPDFSASLPVRPDGKISLPLLGDLAAAGKTPAQLAESVTASLKKYLESPRVTVTVTAINSRNYFVLGEVSRPGKFPLQGEMNALQAVSAAGGLTPYANTKKMYVLRTEGGRQTKLPFNYKAALSGDPSVPNLTIKPGDTIVVP